MGATATIVFWGSNCGARSLRTAHVVLKGLSGLAIRMWGFSCRALGRG